MPILYVRDENGVFRPIPALKGNDGKSAYEQAKEGGYNGTEEEFIAILNGLTNSDNNEHYSDLDNPHETTAQQVGAISEVYDMSSDLDIELREGGSKMTVRAYHGETLNTPYKQGLTQCTHGMVITNAYNEAYGTQLCIPSGENRLYMRENMGGNINAWISLAYNNETAFGLGSSASDGGAVGFGATTENGGAVGNYTTSTDGGAVGYQAETTIGGAIGASSKSTQGFAGGVNAMAGDGGAIGAWAKTIDANGQQIDAIQLGTGVNPNAKTLQVYGYQLMDALGKIVPDRLPVAIGTYEGTNKYGADNPLTLTFPFVPKVVFICPNKKTSDVPFAWIYGSPVGLTAYNNGVAYASNLTWDENTLTWYTTDGYPSYQHNNSNTTYYWVAIG